LELSRLTSNKKYVVAITYTNIAADEIKERIEVLGVETNNLWIGTIHSFCLDWILRPYSSYCNFTKYGFHIIDPQTSDNLKNDLCKEKKENPYNVDWSMCSSGFLVKGSETIQLIRKKYLSTLRSNNEIDFNLILFLSNWLLKKYPQIRKIVSKIFWHFSFYLKIHSSIVVLHTPSVRRTARIPISSDKLFNTLIIFSIGVFN